MKWDETGGEGQEEIARIAKIAGIARIENRANSDL